MTWARAVTVWMVIILAESASGIARRRLVAPALGEIQARLLGVCVGSVLVLVIAWLSIRWLRARTAGAQLGVGALWVTLTLVFEVGLGLFLGYPPERILAEFQVRQGGVLAFGLVFMLFAPALAARARGISPSRRNG